MAGEINIIQRQGIRAVMLTPQGRILLMQIQKPKSDFRVWVTPGGGLKDGEDNKTCLRRELMEETGLQDFDIGPLIWKRQHTFEWGGRMLSQSGQFYLVNVEEFQPCIQNNPSEIEMDVFRQFRWWNVEEIAESQDAFAPGNLAYHLETLTNQGPPESPVDVGV